MSDMQIDLERVVIDPDYRREIIELLNRPSTTAGRGNADRQASGAARIICFAEAA